MDEYNDVSIKTVTIRASRFSRNTSMAARVCLVFILKAASATAIAPFALAQSDSSAEKTMSDLLIVLDSDGRSHTVQHTIASEGPSLTLHLPGSVIPQEVMFFGPQREEYTNTHNANPSTLTISSGSAFARYQHQYGNEVQQEQPDFFVLKTQSVPQNVELVNSSLDHSSTTWVFPNEFEIVSYTVTDNDTGRWISVNNTLTFHNIGTEAVELSINYKKITGTTPVVVNECNEATIPTDACADDKDEDGVPDYRDVCHGDIGQVTNSLGCAADRAMVLDNIVFAIGKTYLDVSARQLLDKVAHALIKSEHTFFELGGHTDNNGAAANNLKLSQKRADAVRHYLMLKGVHPNKLRSTGYGEKYPIRDNTSADGRRANRRIELVIIQ